MLKLKLAPMVALLLGLLTASASANEKIAIADWRGALFQTRLAAEANQVLQQNTAREREQLQRLERDIADKQRLLERDALIMSEQEQQQVLAMVRNEQSAYVNLLQQLEQKRLEAENIFFQRHQPMVEASLRELAGQHEVAVILDVQAVIFAEKELDLTPELLQLLNAKLDAEAAAGSNSAAPPPAADGAPELPADSAPTNQ